MKALEGQLIAVPVESSLVVPAVVQEYEGPPTTGLTSSPIQKITDRVSRSVTTVMSGDGYSSGIIGSCHCFVVYMHMKPCKH